MLKYTKQEDYLVGSKLSQYLQENILGEVVDDSATLEAYSRDGSIFKATPTAVVSPRRTDDVRKIASFLWKLAEKGKVVPITSRGGGTDLGGASIGTGVIVDFHKHLNKVLTFDSRKGVVSLQAGTTADKLQQSLHIHGRYLPPVSAADHHSTVGGIIANDSGSERSVKYGTMRNYAKSLTVVLANGEQIVTEPVSKRELKRIKNGTTFEAKIYTEVDKLIEENKDLIVKIAEDRKHQRTNMGYRIENVKNFKNGDIDLTPLFLGSQGTLGLITEATITTEAHYPRPHCVLLGIANFAQLKELLQLSDKLSAAGVFMLNGPILNYVKSLHYGMVDRLIKFTEHAPMFTVLVELDQSGKRARERAVSELERFAKKNSLECRIEEGFETDLLTKLRGIPGAYIKSSVNGTALPVLEDVSVPKEQMIEFLEEAWKLLLAKGQNPFIWGNIGDGVVTVMPQFDLRSTSEQKELLEFTNAYSRLVLEFGGFLSAYHGDGRLRSLYSSKQFFPEELKLFRKIKEIFDPYNMLNPGVKMNANIAETMKMINPNYQPDRSHLASFEV
jgi:FAD/FMN-containing dehydrogenase